MPINTVPVTLGDLFDFSEVSSGDTKSWHWFISWNISSKVMLIGSETERRCCKVSFTSFGVLQRNNYIIPLMMFSTI
jgi:hypothetical protein